MKSGFLVCKILRTNLSSSRFGFVVSKKISNKATARNKVRRWLQNSVALHLTNMKSSTDVVLVTLSGIEKKEFTDVQKMVAEVFKKLK